MSRSADIAAESGRRFRASGIVALICTFALALSTFASALTVAHLADHDCEGEHCEICVIVHEAQALLTGGAISSGTEFATATFILTLAVLAGVRVLFRGPDTPVSLHVKLTI